MLLFPEAAALLQDAIAIARTARAATVGWRTVCVRAQRAVGREAIRSIAGLDPDLDVPELSRRVRALTASAPADVDTLVFGIFDGIAEGDGCFTGYHLAGARGFDPGSRWLPEPSWVPERPHLVSPSLDALARVAAGIRGRARMPVAHSLRFGMAALLSRFSARDLPYRVVVAFEGGDCAQVTETGTGTGTGTGTETGTETETERRPAPARGAVARPLITRV